MTLTDDNRSLVCNTDDDVMTWNKFPQKCKNAQYVKIDLDTSNADGSRAMFIYL